MAGGTGGAGSSIEDSTGDPREPLRELAEATERMCAAREAIDATGGETLLIGRAENFFVDRPDLDDTLARLKAYADAGADCLYPPGLRTRTHISAAIAAGSQTPAHVRLGWNTAPTVQDLAHSARKRH